MDQFGVLSRLLYNQSAPGNAEPIARILGLVHLYRASGVHLLAFFTFLTWITRQILKNFKVEVEKTRLFELLLVGVTIFWIWKLQDFRITLIRPVLTFLIRTYFQTRGARARIIIPLGITFISEVLISSQSAFSSGAMVYYLSVAGGLIAYDLNPGFSSWKRHLYMAIGSWLPVALIELVKDHEVSYLTPLFSLISLPVISLFLYPLTLVDLLFHHEVSPPVIFIWDIFLKFLFSICDLGPTFSVVSGWTIWPALTLGALFSFLWKRISYPYTVIFLFTILLFGLRAPLAQEFTPRREVVQLDVKQGDAAILKEGQNRIEMVDAGGAKAFAPDEWMQKMSTHGVNQVESVMLSHLDEDHCGALKELLLLLPIGCIETHAEHWKSKKGLRLASWIRENAPETKLSAGGCMQLPQISWFRSKKSSGNELMGGLVFPLTAHRAYFALGDGDEDQELQYEKYFQNEIHAYPQRIWKISHHGSRFSSNFGFLSRLDPEEFWISVGKHNPYHHPHPVTLIKLVQLSGKIYRTDGDGDIGRSFKE